MVVLGGGGLFLIIEVTVYHEPCLSDEGESDRRVQGYPLRSGSKSPFSLPRMGTTSRWNPEHSRYKSYGARSRYAVKVNENHACQLKESQSEGPIDA